MKQAGSGRRDAGCGRLRVTAITVAMGCGRANGAISATWCVDRHREQCVSASLFAFTWKCAACAMANQSMSRTSASVAACCSDP